MGRRDLKETRPTFKVSFLGELIDWFMNSFMKWLHGKVIGEVFDKVIIKGIDKVIDNVIDKVFLIDWLVDWLIDWLIDWFIISRPVLTGDDDTSQFDSNFTKQTPVDSPCGTSLSESVNLVFQVS